MTAANGVRWKAATVVAALFLLQATTAAGSTYAVKASGDEWQPEVRKIFKNDVVKWANPTNRKHDVRSIGSKWSYSVMLAPGDSAKKRFKSIGRYRYRCTLHSAMVEGQCQGMCGLIVVKRP